MILLALLVGALSAQEKSAEIEFHDSYPAMSPTRGNEAILVILDGASGDLGQGPVPALVDLESIPALIKRTALLIHRLAR